MWLQRDFGLQSFSLIFETVLIRSRKTPNFCTCQNSHQEQLFDRDFNKFRIASCFETYIYRFLTLNWMWDTIIDGWNPYLERTFNLWAYSPRQLLKSLQWRRVCVALLDGTLRLQKLFGLELSKIEKKLIESPDFERTRHKICLGKIFLSFTIFLASRMFPKSRRTCRRKV